jgi:hypothetical protein
MTNSLNQPMRLKYRTITGDDVDQGGLLTLTRSEA